MLSNFLNNEKVARDKTIHQKSWYNSPVNHGKKRSRPLKSWTPYPGMLKSSESVFILNRKHFPQCR